MKKALLAALAAAVLPSAAHAHMRNYLINYGYPTLQRGHMEVEAYTDYRTPAGASDGYVWNQTEFAYGMTDRLTLGVYGVMVEDAGYTATKGVARYRLAEKGQLPVDTGFYFEVIKANGGKAENEVEVKLLLSKDFGNLNVVANPMLEIEEEIEASGEKKWETNPILTLGAAYPMGRLTPGFELLVKDGEHMAVPGLYIDLLPEVRLNLGVGIGLVDTADDTQLKTILEIEF